MKRVLTIAGFDPSGWAGVSADLKTFGDLGADGVAAITALTAQNRSTVVTVLPIDPKFVRQEILTLLAEADFDAIKIGMLGSFEIVNMLIRLLKKEGLKNIVLDPVLRSSSGRRLVDKKGEAEIIKLLPLVRVVTPNINEAEVLSGEKIKDLSDMERAAEKIQGFGPEAVVVTGGHVAGPPTDILFNSRNKQFSHFKGVRLKGRKERFHGTGCIFSSALATGLARGYTVKKATDDARQYLIKTLKARR